jgi:NADP-dependent 3-hydroxy acid dehydrogenase YdfG
MLQGATAVVTGASRGIGEAIARAFAAAGCRVALVARGRAPLEKLAGELGAGAFAVPCDVADGRDVNAAAQTIGTAFGGAPRILVNNAGLYRVGPVEALASADMEAMLSVNLVAPLRLIHAFLPAMRAARSGHVVTIGSIADRTAYPGNAGYSATKFGARAVHEVLRVETKGSGVRATLVSPSATDTPIWDGLSAEQRAHFPKPDDMLRADDVARAVLYAVSQPATMNVDEVRITRA